MASDEPANPGEVREDIPLRPSDSSNFSRKLSGIRLIIASFTILTIAVTVALAIQIYKGDYEVVPHGSVATDNRECSEIGTDILKTGGNAVDAAVAASFCLAVVNPHSTGLDAIGSMMIFNYKKSKASDIFPSPPIIIDFSNYVYSDIPNLVRNLAYIHNEYGKLAWNQVVEPAAYIAGSGFNAPFTLVEAIQSSNNTNLFNNINSGYNISLPSLAQYLNIIAKMNITSLVSSDTIHISKSEAVQFNLNNFIIYIPNHVQTSKFTKFLNATYNNDDVIKQPNQVEILYKTAYNIENIISPSYGTSSGLAVIDKDEIHVSLITGLYSLLGNQVFSKDGYILNSPINSSTHSEFMPVIITSHYTCGLRVSLSCGEMVSAAQVINTLLQGEQSSSQLVKALENPRLRKTQPQTVAYEKNHAQTLNDIVLQTLSEFHLVAAPEPYPSCNAVQQIGDNLSSHADSRGGGIASRF